jgi:hypothetical protein
MKMNNQAVFVEIVAKKKGCMLCDLAITVLEEISPEFDKGILKWDVVDVVTGMDCEDLTSWLKYAAGSPRFPPLS